MVAPTGYYRKLVDKQDEAGASSISRSMSKSSLTSSRENSVADLKKLGDESAVEVTFDKAGAGEALIEFKDIVFSYPTRPQKKILDKFSLKVLKGETVALVGPRYVLLLLLALYGLLTI